MMRRLVLLFLSFFLFTSLAIAGKTVERNNSQISVNVNSEAANPAVLAEETQFYETTLTPTPTSVATQAVEIENDVEVEATDTPATPVTGKIDGYIYPGSLITEKTATFVSATSEDGAKKVTDWYEAKIRGEGFNVKSIVRTNTNDNIKNVISAANGSEEIKVEIIGRNANKTSIVVNIYYN